MLRVRVKVKKSQVDYFRRVARNTPLEVQGFLIGEVDEAYTIRIDRIEYTQEYAEQTTSSVVWWQHDYNDLVQKVESEGKRIVGFIHSHPEWDAVLSPDDFTNTIDSGFRVCAVCSVHGRKTRVRFWVPESALPCKIEYE